MNTLHGHVSFHGREAIGALGADTPPSTRWELTGGIWTRVSGFLGAAATLHGNNLHGIEDEDGHGFEGPEHSWHETHDSQEDDEDGELVDEFFVDTLHGKNDLHETDGMDHKDLQDSSSAAASGASIAAEKDALDTIEADTLEKDSGADFGLASTSKDLHEVHEKNDLHENDETGKDALCQNPCDTSIQSDVSSHSALAEDSAHEELDTIEAGTLEKDSGADFGLASASKDLHEDLHEKTSTLHGGNFDETVTLHGFEIDDADDPLHGVEEKGSQAHDHKLHDESILHLQGLHEEYLPPPFLDFSRKGEELHVQENGFVYRMVSARDSEWVECITFDTLAVSRKNYTAYCFQKDATNRWKEFESRARDMYMARGEARDRWRSLCKDTKQTLLTWRSRALVAEQRNIEHDKNQRDLTVLNSRLMMEIKDLRKKSTEQESMHGKETLQYFNALSASFQKPGFESAFTHDMALSSSSFEHDAQIPGKFFEKLSGPLGPASKARRGRKKNRDRDGKKKENSCAESPSGAHNGGSTDSTSSALRTHSGPLGSPYETEMCEPFKVQHSTHDQLNLQHEGNSIFTCEPLHDWDLAYQRIAFGFTDSI